MKTVSKKSKRRLLVLMVAAVSLLAVLLYNITIYAIKIKTSQKEKDTLTKTLDGLTGDEEILKSEIIKLEDPEYVAKFAREKYLYSKDGEKIFRIIK